MKNKFIIVLIILLLLAGGVFAFNYFGGDIFPKSAKQTFFDYLESNNTTFEKGTQKIEKYYAKQQKTPYTNKGQVTANLVSNDIDAESLSMINNSNISFEGAIDLNNKIGEEKFTANLSQGVSIPVTVRVDGNTAGIQSNLLNEKFIAIRNEDLDKLVARFLPEAEGIPSKIEFDKYSFTEEETNKLNKKYSKLFEENLEEELFSKEKVDGETVVTLSMTAKKFTSVLNTVIDTVREDEIILSKVSDKDEFYQALDSFKETLKSMEEDAEEGDKLEIKLYGKGHNKVEKIEASLIENEKVLAKSEIEIFENELVMKVYSENELVLTVNVTEEIKDNDVKYIAKVTANMEGENITVTFSAEYKNVGALDNVEEVYTIELNGNFEGSDLKGTITVNNTVTFTNSINVEKLNSDNAIVLNDATDEEIQALLTNIMNNSQQF